jgi:hypothetical protein
MNYSYNVNIRVEKISYPAAYPLLASGGAGSSQKDVLRCRFRVYAFIPCKDIDRRFQSQLEANRARARFSRCACRVTRTPRIYQPSQRSGASKPTHAATHTVRRGTRTSAGATLW